MFESTPNDPAARGDALSAQTVTGWIEALALLDREVDDAERVEQIRVLEMVKSAAAAAQAVATADLATSQRVQQRAGGLPTRRLGQGIGAQVALARRESPARGLRFVGLAEALVGELPSTLAALRRGETSEWRATLVARETACLSPADRRAADAELGPKIADWGDRQVQSEARRLAYRLDPEGFTAHQRREDKDRRVTLRPAATTMSRFSGLFPLSQGVAAYTTLRRDADRIKAAGDERTRDQIMADLAVERLTGQARASDTPVEVHLLVSADALLGGGDEPAELVGFGPVPAPAARDLVAEAAQVWLRRVFTEPADTALVGMESARREFPLGLRRFLLLRDQRCRTPWCGAPIRHADHVVPDRLGGPTSAGNGQGLCAACNDTKEAPGWHSQPGPLGAGGVVEITTPTGHRYRSRPPPPPASRLPEPRRRRELA